jgi:hypothetical protein
LFNNTDHYYLNVESLGNASNGTKDSTGFIKFSELPSEARTFVSPKAGSVSYERLSLKEWVVEYSQMKIDNASNNLTISYYGISGQRKEDVQRAGNLAPYQEEGVLISQVANMECISQAVDALDCVFSVSTDMAGKYFMVIGKVCLPGSHGHCLYTPYEALYLDPHKTIKPKYTGMGWSFTLLLILLGLGGFALLVYFLWDIIKGRKQVTKPSRSSDDEEEAVPEDSVRMPEQELTVTIPLINEKSATTADLDASFDMHNRQSAE